MRLSSHSFCIAIESLDDDFNVIVEGTGKGGCFASVTLVDDDDSEVVIVVVVVVSTVFAIVCSAVVIGDCSSSRGATVEDILMYDNDDDEEEEEDEIYMRMEEENNLLTKIRTYLCNCLCGDCARRSIEYIRMKTSAYILSCTTDDLRSRQTTVHL